MDVRGSTLGTSDRGAGSGALFRRLAVLASMGLLMSVAACGDGQVDEETASASTAAQPEVVVERGVEYATYKGAPLTLDLYLPADPAGAPIVFGPVGLARNGVIAVTLEQGIPDPPDAEDEGVRWLPDHGALIRAQAEERACAIRYARARASEVGSDDPMVVLTGHSAGGGIAAHVALFGATLEERWDEFAATVGGPPRQVECQAPAGSTHVDALIASAGTYDLYVPVIEGLYGRTYQQQFDPELQQFLASAIGVNPELAVRLTHGTADPAIPVSNSADFEAALTDAGYDVQLTTFDGGHEWPAELSLEILTEVLGQ